jgi:hypothetical protein
MIFRYRIIMYLRTTDREGGIIDIPARHVQQVLSIAGISNPTELGESELTTGQVAALSPLLGFRADVLRYRYHLETLAIDPLRA